MYYSENGAMAKVNVPQSEKVDVNDEYIGFLAFPQNRCGFDFLYHVGDFIGNSTWNGTVTADIHDYDNHYTVQYGSWKVVEKKDQTNRVEAAIIQFYRAAPADWEKDLGTKKRDSFFLDISGTRGIEFKTNG